MEFVQIFLYFIFEFFIFIISVRIIFLITKNSKRIHNSELLISWLIGSIIISSSIATVYSFIQFNGELQYLITIILLGIFVHIDKKSNLEQYYNHILSTFGQITLNILNWKALIVFSLVIPIILFVLSPIDDHDSVFYLDYTIDWWKNISNPYDMYIGKSAFWELGYLPSIVITHGDSFFWVTSFKPFLIILLGAYLVGKIIGLPSKINWLVVFTGSLFFPLWYKFSGLSTLKDDTIIAAGLILVILVNLRTIKENFNRVSVILLFSGLVFLFVKGNGIPFVMISLLLLILFNNKIFKNKKLPLVIFVGILYLFLTSGHYYIHNFLEYGNPIPFTVSENQSVYFYKTSIIFNLNDERTYQYLLYDESNIAKAGYLFPVIFLFGIFGTLGIICYLGIKYFKTRRIETITFVLSIFIFLSWMMYLITPLSASSFSEEFRWLKTLESLRYSEGILILTEILFVFILWKIRIPRLIIVMILGIHLTSRLVYLYQQIHGNFELYVVIYPVIIFICIILIKHFLRDKNNIVFIVLAIFLVFSIFVITSQIVDTNREKWWFFYWNDIIMEIYNLPPSTIALIEVPYEPLDLIPKYPMLGKDFRHTLIYYTEEDLHQRLAISTEDSETKSSLPDYIVIICDVRPPKSCPESTADMSWKFSKYGYNVKSFTRGILLELK